jgi:hypothetical protein
MTTETAEPWAAFFDEPTFLPPGELVRWQREEAVIRAEEQRVEQERTERAELRQERALWEARQYSLHRGLAWDPQRPFANLPDVYARADAMFSLQDAQQRAADRKALLAANLDHLVADLPPPGPVSAGVSSPPVSGATPGPGPAPVPEVAAVRHRYGLPRGPGEAQYVRSRLRRFRARVEESRKKR